MAHHTKDKGDLAVIKTIADLSEKGYVVFVPVACEHLPFDLIAYKDGKSYRIQVKYSNTGYVKTRTSWSDKNGTHTKHYNYNDFDYYAIYIPDVNAVCYQSINYKGIRLTTQLKNSSKPFWWYEDFLNFTNETKQKTFKDFNITLIRPTLLTKNKPTKEDLKNLLWSYSINNISKILKTSYDSINNWIKEYELEKPPAGYWSKKKSSTK